MVGWSWLAISSLVVMVAAVAAKDESSSHKKASKDNRLLPLIVLSEVRKVGHLDLQGLVRHLDFFEKKIPGALHATLSVGRSRGECSFPD